MSMQIPDYAVFAQMPISARRQSLATIKRFAGQHAAALFLQVYQFDPDAEMREMARQELAKQGITPPADPTPINVPTAAETGASFGGRDSSFSFTESLGDAAVPQAASDAIDGGSGRPVQRGPQLANIFTLYRRSDRYLTGERSHIPHSMLGYVLTIGILAVTFAFIFFTFHFSTNDSDAATSLDLVLVSLGLIFGAIVVGAVGVFIWNFRRDRRFENEGTLLLGRVLRASGTWHSGSEGGRSYKVTIDYRVRLPEGTVLDHRASHTRNDLSRQPLPQPGDPIAVIAIDRDHLRVL